MLELKDLHTYPSKPETLKKGYYKGSISGYYDMGALIIRMDFGDHYTIVRIRSPRNTMIMI